LIVTYWGKIRNQEKGKLKKDHSIMAPCGWLRDGPSTWGKFLHRTGKRKKKTDKKHKKEKVIERGKNNFQNTFTTASD